MIKSYKANSLVVTLIISLILAVICSSAILLAYYNRNQQFRSDIDRRLETNLQSAINLVLADTAICIQPISDTLDLFKENTDSVAIKKELWGTFQLASLKTFFNHFKKQTCFFYGPEMPGYMYACLYVADHRRPIALAGNTKLIGNGFLPRAGIKASYINQEGFNGDKLINGKIMESLDSLPDLRKEVSEQLYKILLNQSSAYSQNIPDSMHQSFTDAAICFYKREKIRLTNCSFSGHIIIKSNSEIEVDSSAHLRDIILAAPCIRFTQGVNARLQAFASDSLIIEKNCSFGYPTTVALVKTKNSNLLNKLTIAENSQINGTVLAICNNSDLYKTFVEIGDKTIVNGIIYTMGYLHPGGNVTGIVMTDFFIYRSPATTYENYLVDVSINREQLSQYFLTPSIFTSSMPQQISEWVR